MHDLEETKATPHPLSFIVVFRLAYHDFQAFESDEIYPYKKRSGGH